MDIGGVNPIGHAFPVEAPSHQTQPAEHRDLVPAVQAVNQAELFGQDNELTFMRDRATQRTVIRLVNRKTNEVIRQMPPEYVLRMAADIKSKAG